MLGEEETIDLLFEERVCKIKTEWKASNEI